MRILLLTEWRDLNSNILNSQDPLKETKNISRLPGFEIANQ